MRYGRALREREAALLAVQGRAPTCQPLSSLGQVGCARSSLVSHCARAISGECAAHALATCVRPAALVRVGPYFIEAHCASGTAVSLGARPCSDVRAPASNERVTCACAQVNAAQTARALSFSREEAQHAHLRRARAPPR